MVEHCDVLFQFGYMTIIRFSDAWTVWLYGVLDYD